MPDTVLPPLVQPQDADALRTGTHLDTVKVSTTAAKCRLYILSYYLLSSVVYRAYFPPSFRCTLERRCHFMSSNLQRNMV